jgi:hypothetical protein
LEGEAQAKLEQAEEILGERRKALTDTDLDFLDEQSVFHRHLQEHDQELLDKIVAFVASCHKRRQAALSAVAGRSVAALPALAESGTPELVTLVGALKARRIELEERNPVRETEEYERELLELRHRELLKQNLPRIKDYVLQRAWARKAAKAGGSTRHITRKYNEVFNRLVTERYVELFEKILDDLQRPLKVEIRTAGRKGETYKQIALTSDASGPSDSAAPDKVLSEGEKRAVALADFLTEVALDTTSSGIILDDPVTSLDLEWRETIAEILASEAKQRQVIVFTHDLPFLYFVKKHAGQEMVEMETHWIKRGEIDDRPGYVFLNNSPAMEREYRKANRARDLYMRAKNAPAAEQEALLRQGLGALRTGYEAFIVFDLFNEVVMRFDERISFGRLRGIAWDDDIARQVDAACARLSRHIEGHLHSDAFAGEKPTCQLLMKEINEFDALRTKLKQLKRS